MKKYAKEGGNINIANATDVKAVSGPFIVTSFSLDLQCPPSLHSGLKFSHSMKSLKWESSETIYSLHIKDI